MAKLRRLYVVLLTALALWKRCLAEWNATDGTSNQTASVCQDNCTAEKDTEQLNGHFSECPEELLYYCIHGDCRYIKEQKAPSCRCHINYRGSRCEYVTWDERVGARERIIIGCAVAVLLLLMILVISICICSHPRCRFWDRRRRPTDKLRNGTKKRSMLDSSTPDSTELTHINSV